MKIEQYKEEVRRTLVILPTLKENLIHMSYGISTEIGELLDVYKKQLAYGKSLDITNIKEELGDICWYIFNGFNFLNIYSEEIETQINKNKEQHLEDLKDMDLQIILLKLPLFNSYLNESMLHQINEEDIHHDFGVLLICILVIINKLNFDFEEIMEMNINKLRIRFPEKFSQDNALNRNLEEERKSLEQK